MLGIFPMGIKKSASIRLHPQTRLQIRVLVFIIRWRSPPPKIPPRLALAFPPVSAIQGIYRPPSAHPSDPSVFKIRVIRGDPCPVKQHKKEHSFRFFSRNKSLPGLWSGRTYVSALTCLYVNGDWAASPRSGHLAGEELDPPQVDRAFLQTQQLAQNLPSIGGFSL